MYKAFQKNFLKQIQTRHANQIEGRRRLKENKKKTGQIRQNRRKAVGISQLHREH